MNNTDKVINLDGDTWRVIGVGKNDGVKTFIHMASTTRGKYQKNGFYPIQMCDWVENKIIELAN